MRRLALIGAFLLFACAAIAQTATVPCVGCPQTGAGGKNVESSAFVSTSPQTMNTTSDTSCFGTGFTVSANTAVVGNRYRLRCAGYYTVPAPGNTRVLTFKLKWGSTVINSDTITPTPSNTNPYYWWTDVTCTINAIGASGTIYCVGTISYLTAQITGTVNVAPIGTGTTAATIDTTASSKLDITGAWDATTGSPSATANEAGIEIVN